MVFIAKGQLPKTVIIFLREGMGIVMTSFPKYGHGSEGTAKQQSLKTLAAGKVSINIFLFYNSGFFHTVSDPTMTGLL